MGEIVCTVLQRKASPLIRFRLRDLGYLDAGPCPRGLALPGLYLRGRIVDQVSGEESEPASAQLSPLQIEEVLYSIPEMGGNYQIYLGSEQTLVIDVELNCPIERTGAALERIRRELVPVLERFGHRGELHAVAFIPRSGGKTRRIRPLRDRPTMPG
jgi:phenylacetate-CoA ligase